MQQNFTMPHITDFSTSVVDSVPPQGTEEDSAFLPLGFFQSCGLSPHLGIARNAGELRIPRSVLY